MKFVDVKPGEKFRFKGKVWKKELCQNGKHMANAQRNGETRFFRWDEEVYKVYGANNG